MNKLYYLIHIYRTYKIDPLSKKFIHRPPLRYSNGVQAIFAFLCSGYYLAFFYATYKFVTRYLNENYFLAGIWVGGLIVYFGLEFYYTKKYSAIVDFYGSQRENTFESDWKLGRLIFWASWAVMLIAPVLYYLSDKF